MKEEDDLNKSIIDMIHLGTRYLEESTKAHKDQYSDQAEMNMDDNDEYIGAKMFAYFAKYGAFALLGIITICLTIGGIIYDNPGHMLGAIIMFGFLVICVVFSILIGVFKSW